MACSLVIQLARLGDVLQSKRLLLSLAAASRPGEVHLLVDASLRELAESVYPFAHVHALRAAGGPAEPAALLRDNFRVLSELRGLDFDAVYNLNYSGLSLALSGLFPREIIRGHWLEGPAARRSHWVELAFRWTAQRRLSPLNLIDFWGLLAPQPIAPAAVNPPAAPRGGGIGVALAGRAARRSIPPEALAPLVAAHFARLGGADILLLGGRAEQPLARRLRRGLPERLGSRLRDLTGRTTLADLPEIMGGLDLLLTPDTGLMHLGAHLGAPLDALFLSSAWCWETGPYGLGHTIRQATAPCAPCLETAPCPYRLRCLDPFTDENLAKLMAGREPARAPQGLVSLEGRFDALGQDYVPVAPGPAAAEFGPAEAQARRGLRHLLAEYLALPGSADLAPPLSLQRALREQFFNESDWLLPRTRGMRP